MSSKIDPERKTTLALRLTLWYAAAFAVSSALALALVYALVVAAVVARTDADLREDIEDFAGLYRDEGIDRVTREMALDTRAEQAASLYFRIWSRDGKLLTATPLGAWPGLVPLPSAVLRPVLDEGLVELDTPVVPTRQDRLRTVIGELGPGLVIEIGQSLEGDQEFIATIMHGFIVTLVAVLALGGPIGWLMANRALRGVRDVTRTAGEIAAGALDRRVPVAGHGDEIDQLARMFNAMLDRIQVLIVGMRDIADNLAHDIRSPLTRMRAAAEMSLSSARSGDAREALAVGTLEECDRLLSMINTTLDIAEADSGAAPLDVTPVNLHDIVLDACELFHTVAEDRDISMTVEVSAQLGVVGDRQRLQRVVANLLDNALKYSTAGGRVRLAAGDNGTNVWLTVEDCGIGIAGDDLPHIFQRFYRCERSRSQTGSGLGLSLALAFVRAHGGDITVTSAEGVGSTFCVVLPPSLRRLTPATMSPGPRASWHAVAVSPPVSE